MAKADHHRRPSPFSILLLLSYPPSLPNPHLHLLHDYCRARQQSDTGRIVNLMSADVNQLQMFFYPYVQQLVTGPATIIAALVLLWFQISWTTFIGLAILLVSTPLTGIFVAKLSAYRREMLKYTDKVS